MIDAITPKAPDTPAAPEPAVALEPLEEPGGVKLPIDDDDATPPAQQEPGKQRDKAGDRIAELKEEVKTHRATVEAERQARAQAEARILELEGLAQEATTLKERLTEAEKVTSVTQLERSRPFQEQVLNPLSTISDEAGEIADRYALDVDELFKALEMPDDKAARARLKEITSGLEIDPDDYTTLRELRTRTQPLLAKRAEMYANVDATLLELKVNGERETAAQAAARAAERKAAIPAVVSRVVKWLPAIKDAVNDAAAKAGEVDPDVLDPANKVFNQLAGHALPALGKMYAAVIAERDELLDELSRYRTAQPKPGGFSPPSANTTRPATMEEAIQRSLGMI